MKTIAIALLLAACGSSEPKSRAVPPSSGSAAQTAVKTATPTAKLAAPAGRPIELPAVYPDATVPAKSWAFVSFNLDGKRRVGAVPASAVSDAGVDVAQLETGKEVGADAMVDAVRGIMRERAATEPPPPSPKQKAKAKKKKPCKANTPECAREQAIEQAREAGVLGEEPDYPTCGDPMEMLHGAGDERPRDIAPEHMTVCPLGMPDETASFAALVLADRELPAATVIQPFVGDSGVLLARFGVTTDAGKHVRTLDVQFGQNTRPGPLGKPRPRHNHVIVLDATADPFKLRNTFPAGEGDAWIWIKGDVKYQRLVEMIQVLSAQAAMPITITLDDPR